MIAVVGLMGLFVMIGAVGWIVGSAIFLGQLIIIRLWWWPQFKKEWTWFRHGHKRGFFNALEISVNRVWEDRKKALHG